MQVTVKAEWDKKGVLQNIYLPEVEIVNTNFSNQHSVLARQCLDYRMLTDKISNNCKERVYLKNNWYGSEDGLRSEDSFTITGDYNLDGFKKNKMIVDPVILIPGILGSAFNTKGELKIDPIWHKYDDLVKSFKKNGFKENENFFAFPYDWRRTNKDTAILLKYKIKQVKEKTKISKVDVVAHSMGGLVAREYVENGDYKNDIDQLIFLGTPQKGSPKSYLMWEAGGGFLKKQDRLLRHHLNHEANEKGYDDLGKYVREKIPSVQELLPDYDYLVDTEKNNELKKYFEGYPRNEFLEKLNEKENLTKLKNLQIINFVGKNGNSDTISKIKIKKKEVKDKWKHGYPNDFDNKNGDRGLIRNTGDGTVPLSSAMSIGANIEKEFKVNHTALPTKTQCEIIKELTGYFVDENVEEEDQVCKYIDKWDIPNMLLFQVFSPIDIQIIAPDGKRVGKNFETGGFYDEIEGAYYTGYDTDTEFVTIPNPIDGEYKVLTQGTSDGNYKIEATDISQNDNDEVSEQTLIFEGETILDKRYQHQFTIKNSSILNVTVTDTDDDKNVGDGNDEEENITNENESELQSNENSNNELVTTTENDDTGNSKSNKHKKKKNRKKHKSNKVALADTNRDGDNNSAIKSTNENKEQPNSSEKNNPENVVMGEESKNPSDQVATNQVENESKSFYALGAVILIGILLLMGNLFGWSKIKKKKGDNDF